MRKPDLITKDDLFFDYYYTQLIEEQKKTNKLLTQLLEGGKENVIKRGSGRSVRENNLDS